MHLILTGATGLVGSGVLDAMMKMKDITQISILSRRPVKMAEDRKDPRVNIIIHKDYNKYSPEVLSQLKGATGCVWALGISQTQVSKEEYIKITKDYALSAAKAFQGLPASDTEPFNFVFISGRGARHDPGPLTSLYGRIKGETEIALAEMRKANPQFHVSCLRAGAVDPSDHDAIKPYIPTRPMLGRIVWATIPLWKPLTPTLWAPTEPLGRVATEIAMGRHVDQFAGMSDVQMLSSMPVLDNTAIMKLAGVEY